MENANIKKVWIYALRDPRTHEIKYIGKSINPQKRYKGHIYQSRLENTKKSNWIKKLTKLGLTPILEILLETSELEYGFWEEYYIKKFISEGYKLTNYDEKGIGVPGGITKRTILSLKKKLSKKVYQYDLNGFFIKEYKSVRDAERETNINHGNISKCCKKIYQHVGGYVFRYEKKEKIEATENKKAEKKKVLEIDKEGQIINEFESIADAAKKTGIDASNISRVCNKKKKYVFKRSFIFKME